MPDGVLLRMEEALRDYNERAVLDMPRYSLETLSQQRDRLALASMDEEQGEPLCGGCGNPEDDCECENMMNEWTDDDAECDCITCREIRGDESDEEFPYGELTVTDSAEEIERWIAANA